MLFCALLIAQHDVCTLLMLRRFSEGLEVEAEGGGVARNFLLAGGRGIDEWASPVTSDALFSTV